jgi:hypothetical protein
MDRLEAIKLTQDQAHQQLLGTLVSYADAFMRAIVDKLGSREALELVRPYVFDLGKKVGESAPQSGIKGKDAIAIGTLVHTVEQEVLKIEGEIKEASPDKVVKVCTKCALKDCAPETCMQFESLVAGEIDAIAPGQYTWKLTKIMPKGDKVCEWVVEKKN